MGEPAAEEQRGISMCVDLPMPNKKQAEAGVKQGPTIALNLLHHVHALHHAAKHHMPAVPAEAEQAGSCEPGGHSKVAAHVMQAGQAQRSAARLGCHTYSQGVATVVMKNWLPFVLGPALAIDRTPGPVCFNCTGGSTQSVGHMHAGIKEHMMLLRPGMCVPGSSHR